MAATRSPPDDNAQMDVESSLVRIHLSLNAENAAENFAVANQQQARPLTLSDSDDEVDTSTDYRTATRQTRPDDSDIVGEDAPISATPKERKASTDSSKRNTIRPTVKRKAAAETAKQNQKK